MGEKAIDDLLDENRKFPPAKEFAKQANVRGKKLPQPKNRLKHWESFAKELHWFKKWKKILDWKLPFAKWFVGGKTNMAYNCLDRHLTGPRRNKAAILWEGEPGDERTLTYDQLHREVCRFANGLKSLGVKKGDRVTLYMPMVPELPIAMLACARIGAPHSIVFGGFSAESLQGRINDSQSKLVITADGCWRRGSVLQLKTVVDEAVAGSPCVEKVVVYKRIGSDDTPMQEGRDIW